MLEVDRNVYLTGLPIFIDEHTEIDTWEALRTRLPSNAYRSGAKMQRIRAKPATRNGTAKSDPVLYVVSEQKAVQAARLRGMYFRTSLCVLINSVLLTLP